MDGECLAVKSGMNRNMAKSFWKGASSYVATALTFLLWITCLSTGQRLDYTTIACAIPFWATVILGSIQCFCGNRGNADDWYFSAATSGWSYALLISIMFEQPLFVSTLMSFVPIVIYAVYFFTFRPGETSRASPFAAPPKPLDLTIDGNEALIYFSVHGEIVPLRIPRRASQGDQILLEVSDVRRFHNPVAHSGKLDVQNDRVEILIFDVTGEKWEDLESTTAVWRASTRIFLGFQD